MLKEATQKQLPVTSQLKTHQLLTVLRKETILPMNGSVMYIWSYSNNSGAAGYTDFTGQVLRWKPDQMLLFR